MLEKGKEHGRLGIFGEGLVLAIFDNSNNFCPLASPEFEMATNRLVDGAEDLACKFAIHDGHDGSLVFIVHGEGSACQKCGPGGAEIVGRDIEVLSIGCSARRSEIGSGIGVYVG